MWTVARLTTPGEIDEVVALDALCFERPWGRDAYLRELDDPARCWLLGVRGDDRRLAGHCAFWQVVDELHINTLAVHPEVRRQGAARALLADVLAVAERVGARSTFLEVRASNQAAVALYEQAGFRVAQVRRGYYSIPVEDALVLCRTT